MLKLVTCEGAVIWLNPYLITSVRLFVTEEGTETRVTMMSGGSVAIEGDRADEIARTAALLMNRATYTVDAADVSVPE